VELAKWTFPIIALCREPYEAKVCAAGRGAESLTESRGVRRETPGSSTYLRAKAQGDKSMSEKQGTWEGVYDVALRDPCDMVKATLPEPQSPAVEPHTHRYHASEAVPSRARRAAFAACTLRGMGDEERLHSRGCVGHLRRASTFSTTGTRDGLQDASPTVTESS
jgi:hypothetical protein